MPDILLPMRLSEDSFHNLEWLFLRSPSNHLPHLLQIFTPMLYPQQSLLWFPYLNQRLPFTSDLTAPPSLLCIFSLACITHLSHFIFTFRFKCYFSPPDSLESIVYIPWWHWFLYHSPLCSLYLGQRLTTSCSINICWIKEWIQVGTVAVVAVRIRYSGGRSGLKTYLGILSSEATDMLE